MDGSKDVGWCGLYVGLAAVREKKSGWVQVVCMYGKEEYGNEWDWGLSGGRKVERGKERIDWMRK